MRSRLRLVSLGIVVAGLLPVRGLAQAPDRGSGTWELNVGKSTYSPGPPPKSQTRTYEVSGQSLTYTTKGVDAEGKPVLVQYTARYDGKDHPMTGNLDSDTISLKLIDASTVEFTQKKAGKVVITGRRMISTDGKVMTVIAKGINAKGQTINNVLVFEKRQPKAASGGSVRGVWRVAEVTTTGPNASTITKPQPGLYIFTAGHYSIVRVHGDTPRPDEPQDVTKATAAQLVASWDPFTANSGSYERTGGNLIVQQIAAKNPTVMAPGSFTTYTYKLDGNTLWLTGTGNKAGPIANPTTVKLTRVE